MAQFQTWNPAVGPSCSSLLLDYYYCIAVPGTPTTRSTTSTTKTTSTLFDHTPTQTGIISSCIKYYKTVSGDTCQVISDRFGTFGVASFISWNPAVESDCSQLYLSYYYCIAVPGTPTTRTSTSTTKTMSKTPTPTPKGPQPQQPGIVSNCNKYYLVKSGDSCYTIEQAQSVSAANFLKWNTGIKRFVFVFPFFLAFGAPLSKISPSFRGIVSPERHTFRISEEKRTSRPFQTSLLNLQDTTNANVRISKTTSDCSNLFVGYYICIQII